MIFEINENSQNKAILDREKEAERLPVHSFHRYYGKLIPAIPSAFIKEFTDRGDLVFDPFSGSGTTAVEAVRLGRNFYGVEINPLAQKIASVKVSDLDRDVLDRLSSELFKIIDGCQVEPSEDQLPFLQNRDHWFKDFVQRDLVRIKRSIDLLFESSVTDGISNRDQYRDFYLMTVSAILRNVSNADTMHVFPGVSKRMRALEAEQKIHIDVISSFERAVKKRTAYYGFNDGTSTARIVLGDSTDIDLSEVAGKVDLIVTNPPYISSVRYIETLKLEMYWMEYIKSVEQYDSLAHKMLGNDRMRKSEYQTVGLTGYDEIDLIIEDMKAKDMKCAKVISDFFVMMEKVISNMALVLKSGGKAVIKISDSKIRKVKVETGRLMTLIAQNHGFELYDLFLDEINNNSRSLTTARNSYSDIITHDHIIIWEKR